MNSSRCSPKRMRSREKKRKKNREETQMWNATSGSKPHLSVRMRFPNACLRFSKPFFIFLFFFSMLMNSNKYCSCTVQETNFTVHETHNYFIQKKILKMGLKVLFIHLKIILLQCFSIFIFQFSVFNFQLYPLYSNGSHFILISLFVQVQVLW